MTIGTFLLVPHRRALAIPFFRPVFTMLSPHAGLPGGNLLVTPGPPALVLAALRIDKHPTQAIARAIS